MLVAYVPFENLKTLPFGDELEYSFQFLFNVDICHYSASVPWSPNDMVLATVSAVFQFIEFGQHKITS